MCFIFSTHQSQTQCCWVQCRSNQYQCLCSAGPFTFCVS